MDVSLSDATSQEFQTGFGGSAYVASPPSAPPIATGVPRQGSGVSKRTQSANYFTPPTYNAFAGAPGAFDMAPQPLANSGLSVFDPYSTAQPQANSQHYAPVSYSQHGRPACAAIAFAPFGTFLTSFPMQGQIVVHRVQTLLPRSDKELLSAFSKPLQDASKSSITAFIEKQSALCDGPYSDCERALWRLLRLSLERSGTLEIATQGTADLFEDETAGDFANNASNLMGMGMAEMSMDIPDSTNTNAIMEKLLNQLKGGDRAGACMSAASQGQWATALVLASHCDLKVYNNVMQMYATQGLPQDSPFRTLYLTFAGRTDLLFDTDANGDMTLTPAVLHRWMDNIAVVLNGGVDNLRQLLIHFGDALLKSLHTSAAHLCYVLAECSTQSLEHIRNRSGKLVPPKLVLLGCDHTKSPSFLHKDVISLRRTEILEYSKRLGNPQHSAAQLLPFFIAHATLLADFGYVETASHYLNLSKTLMRDHGRNFRQAKVLKHVLDAVADRLECSTGSKAPPAPSSNNSNSNNKGIGKLFGWFNNIADTIVGEANTSTNPSSSNNNSTNGSFVPKAPNSAGNSNSNAFVGMDAAPNQNQNVLSNQSPANAVVPLLRPSSSFSSLNTTGSDQHQPYNPTKPPAPKSVPTDFGHQQIPMPSRPLAPTQAPQQIPIPEPVAVPTPSVPEPSQQVPEQKQPEPAPQPKSDPPAEKPKSGGSLWGRVSGALFSKRDGQAHLPEEMTYYYNEELKCYVERGKEEEKRLELQQKLAPPPKVTVAAPAPALGSPNTSSSTSSPAPSPLATVASMSALERTQQRKSNVRSRYHDPHNKGNPATPAPVAPSRPKPPLPSLNVFNPGASDVPDS